MKTCDICDDEVAYIQVLKLYSPKGESDPEFLMEREFCVGCFVDYVRRLTEAECKVVADMILKEDQDFAAEVASDEE